MPQVGLRPLDQPAARDDDGTSRDTSRSALSPPSSRVESSSRGEASERIDDLQKQTEQVTGSPWPRSTDPVWLATKKERETSPGSTGRGRSTEISEPLHGMRILLRPASSSAPQGQAGSALDLPWICPQQRLRESGSANKRGAIRIKNSPNTSEPAQTQQLPCVLLALLGSGGPILSRAAITSACWPGLSLLRVFDRKKELGT